MHKLNLTNLETLCWIARLGSFTAAAQRLNTTQPAISRRVKELERALRISLFHRQGRRMELTIQGRDLVNRAQPLISRLDEVVVSLENSMAATGTIRMGVGEMVTLTWFADFMARLKRDMPRVNYEIEVGLTIDMRQKLELGMLDLAIVAAPVESSRLTAVYLGTAQVQWMIARALHDNARKRNAVVKEILEAHTIWCVARPAQMHQMAMETLRRYGAAVGSINTSDNLQSIIEAVASGAGIALLPANLLAGARRRDSLVPLSDQLPPEPLDFSIASHRDQNQTIIKRIVEVAVAACTFPRGESVSLRAGRRGDGRHRGQLSG